MNLANCLSVYLCAKNHTSVQCIDGNYEIFCIKATWEIRSKYHAKSMISQTRGPIIFFFSIENPSAAIDKN